MSKIKNYLIGVLAIFSAIATLFFRREKTKRKEAEEKASNTEAKNEAVSNVLNVQRQINTTTQKVLQKPKKRRNKAKKIILPLLFFILVSCTKTEYLPVVYAPELYTYESNIELVLDEASGNYCMTEDEALKLKQILEAYKEEIDIYNHWRKANEIR